MVVSHLSWSLSLIPTKETGKVSLGEMAYSIKKWWVVTNHDCQQQYNKVVLERWFMLCGRKGLIAPQLYLCFQ